MYQWKLFRTKSAHMRKKGNERKQLFPAWYFACTQFFNEIVQPLIRSEREENLAKCCKTLYLQYRHLIFKRKKLFIFYLSSLVVCFVFHEKIISRMETFIFHSMKASCVNGIDSTSRGTISFDWLRALGVVVEISLFSRSFLSIIKHL